MSDQQDGIRAPEIITGRAPHKLPLGTTGAPANGPRLPLVVSHPIPPLRIEPRAVRAAGAPGMSLSADRTNYVVSESEFPTYAVGGAAPNQAILWSMRLNDLLVVEDQPFGTVTDNNGSWSGRGSPWTDDHAGFWEVLAKTGERQASVRFVVSADLGQPKATPPNEMLGVAHVGGLYRFASPGSELEPESFLVEGAKHVRNLGARHLFVYLSPQHKSDYPFDDSDDVPYASLTALAGNPAYRELFGLPFETFVLTAYSFANWDWIQSRGQSDSVPFDADGEREELAELVCHLAATYPGKTFIIKNWEGDWQMKLSYDLDAVASEAQVAGFLDWMRARQAGVEQGRNRCGARGVRHAIEFNLIHQAQRRLPSVLASIIPQADSDLLAYASWWSLTRGEDVVRNVHDDITFIRSLPGIGTRPLIVTEFGLSYLEPELDQLTTDAVEAFSQAEVPMALYWQIFDNGPDLALVGREATRFASWHRLRAFLQVRNDASFVHDRTSLPRRIIAGQQYPATVSVRNNGMLFDPVVGYALGLLDSQGKLKQIIWIRREVPTGEIVNLDFVLNAPGAAGVYSFQMFQHGVELFGDKMAVEVHASTETEAGAGERD